MDVLPAREASSPGAHGQGHLLAPLILGPRTMYYHCIIDSRMTHVIGKQHTNGWIYQHPVEEYGLKNEGACQE